MPLTFGYLLLQARRPVVTLAGRLTRPYPIIEVTVIGPSGTRIVQGLLDSGSDDTVFPDFVAAQVGIDLTGAPAGSASGVGMVSASVRYAEVSLRIANGGERREWRALVGFTSAPLKRSLLGFAGFLQFFTATFRGDREEVELVVNSLYPGP